MSDAKTGQRGIGPGAPASAFEAAEMAYDRALADERVTGAKKLEDILGGNGTYTAEVAFGVWVEVMTELGFGEYATEEAEPT